MDFIGQVTRHLVSTAGWQGLQQYTVVFPMHRAGLFMKEQLKELMQAEQLTTPVIVPRFCTLEELVDELCAPYLLPDDEIHSVCSLYHIFCEKTGSNLPLDVFYGWGRQLLTDFSNADRSDVDAMQLFSNSAAARELEETHLDEDTLIRLRELVKGTTDGMQDSYEDSIRKTLTDLWASLPAIYEAFGASQREQGIAYSGARLKYVVENFEDKILPQLQGRRFAFVGFNYLLGKERALMKRMQEAGIATFYWDHRTDFYTNRNAYKYTKENVEVFGQALPEEGFREVQRGEEGLRKVKVIATATENAQAQYVYDWLEEHAGASGRIGVVIADEAMLEPVIYALPERLSGKVNITKGYPLRNTKVFSFIVSYLSNPAHDKRDGETYADVLQRLIREVTAKMEKEYNPDEQNWQQSLIQESYYQASVVINRFCMLIEDGTLAEVTQFATLRNLLRRHLETVLLPFHGDPITQVQVIGVLETRLLDFDHLLVLNVEEGVIPKTPVDNSFIPFYLRKYYHMPTGGESAEVYAYNFFRLLHRAKDCTLLFCNATEGDNKKGMSRFLMQMLTSGEYDVERMQLTESCDVATSEVLPAIEGVTPLYQQEKKKLSPSAINAYIACPMRFYLQEVLQLSAAEEGKIVMPQNDLGTLIHGAIEKAYTIMNNGKSNDITVSPDRVQAFLDNEQDIHEALMQGFANANAAYRRRHDNADDFYKPEEHKAETLVARTNLRNVLQTDMLTSRHGLKIIAMEKWQEFPLTLTIDGQDYTVVIGGYVDRLDETNGLVRVIDYKTGNYKDEKLVARTLESLFAESSDKTYILQTLLYCKAVLHNGLSGNKPITSGLWFTGKKDCDTRLTIQNAPFNDYKQVQKEFEALLEDKVQEILTATSFPKCAEDKCKSYCPFLLLCGRKVREF